MATKPKPPPTTSADAFGDWLTDGLPEDVWAYFDVSRSCHRERGRRSTSVEYRLHVHKGAGHFSDGIDFKTHDLAALGRWLVTVAIPHLFPPPVPPRPPAPRRLGQRGRELEDQRPKALTHNPPEELLFGN